MRKFIKEKKWHFNCSLEDISMGKIRTDRIKRIAKELVAKYHKNLSTNFDDNKVLISKLTNVASKRVRNRIAGYVTRIMVQIEDGKVQVIEKLSIGTAQQQQQ